MIRQNLGHSNQHPLTSRVLKNQPDPKSQLNMKFLCCAMEKGHEKYNFSRLLVQAGIFLLSIVECMYFFSLDESTLLAMLAYLDSGEKNHFE